jgi:uncharacterized protein YfaS (alpha-2-macroglobulin family)
VILEDYIPAGTEILDINLKTTSLSLAANPGENTDEFVETALFDPTDPFADGWGWWFFNAPLVFDDHIAWTADYLPAGTYTLRYSLNVLQAGEYRVLPARARQFYFTEVQGTSAGQILIITP